MTSSDTDSLQFASCAKWGCGCLGVLGGGGVGVVLLVAAFEYALFYYPSVAWSVLYSILALILGGVLGIFVGVALFETGDWGPIANRRMKAMGPVWLGLGVLCLGTVIGMSQRSGFHYEGTVAGWTTPDGAVVQVEDAEVPEDSLGILGPIEVSEGNTEVGVRIHQEIEDGTGYFQRWNFITVILLDENKDYLLSFGSDVWNYNQPGWHEEDTEYETVLAVPSAGTYYLQVRAESGTEETSSFMTDTDTEEVPKLESSSMNPIHVELYERATWGNPAPLQWGGCAAFLFGVICLVGSRVGRADRIEQHIRDGGKIQYDGQVWQVGEEMNCVYDNWRATEWSLHPTGPGAKTPRYLEHEYERFSDWENWLISEPVALNDLTCEGPDGGEMTVREYVDRHGELPDAMTHADQPYSLDDSGTVRRANTRVDYSTYSPTHSDPDSEMNRFVTIEGTPGESLDAVVGESLTLWLDLSIVEDEQAA